MTDIELLAALEEITALLRLSQSLCAYALTPPRPDGDGERWAA